MTEVLDRDAAVAPSAQEAVNAGRAWRSHRGALLIGAVVLLAAVLMALLTGAVRSGYLDPDAATQDGSRALRNLLADRGIAVSRQVEPTVRAGRTTVITSPLVDPAAVARAAAELPEGADLVLVEPGPEVLRAVRRATDLEVSVAGEVDVDERRPSCDLDVAVTAGVARTGGSTFEAPGADHRCYAARGGPSLVVIDTGGRRVVLLGSGALLTNARLDEDGNAALALGLLARHDEVQWVHPRLDELGFGDQPRSLVDLLPRRLRWALLQLAVAVVLLALWRGRRLGPVVVEPLPVVVRAAETVEGRARLYEGASANDRAAQVLRFATTARMARVLGLGHDPRPEAVVPAVAERVRRSSLEVEVLLYGGPPASDAQLVRLAAELDSLEREVRST